MSSSSRHAAAREGSPQDPRIQQAIADFGLMGRRLYLPQMPYGGSYLLAAAIRSIGFDAWVTSDSDERTLDLGGRVTSGDECYPQKITLGDFLRIIEDEGRDNVAFLMPSANGPCRFGQYLHLVRAKFDELGYDDVPVISITSSDGYSSIGAYSQQPHPDRLARGARPGHPDEAAAQDAPLRAREGRVGRRLPDQPRGGRRGDRARRHLAQGAARGARPRDGARPRPLPRHPRRLRRHPAAHRRRRRDLLPPEHVLQLRPHPCGRGAGRGVLAVGHRRVGLVHRRRAAPAAPRRAPPRQQGRRHPLHQEQDHAQGRARHVRAVPRRLRRATRSRTTCATCSR